jgi:hypothetical protein
MLRGMVFVSLLILYSSVVEQVKGFASEAIAPIVKARERPAKNILFIFIKILLLRHQWLNNQPNIG